jgi:hypothetical protein
LPIEASGLAETELALAFTASVIWYGSALPSRSLGARGETVITIGDSDEPRSKVRIDDICGDRAQFFAALAPALGIAHRR